MSPCAYLAFMETPLLYKRLGTAIKERRKQLGLTQEQLSDQLEISRASLANVETGRQRLLVHQLYRLARGLGVKVVALLPESNEVEDLEVLDGVSVSENLNLKQKQQVLRLMLDDRPLASSRGKHGQSDPGGIGEHATA